MNDIRKYVKQFSGDPRQLCDGRYASFDYCFNYFQSFKKNPKRIVAPKNLQNSCLQIGFYIASWGMYRGSSFLLQHSCHFLEKPLEVIANFDVRIWDIDADRYSEEYIQLLLDCAEKIRESMKKNLAEGGVTDTLVTKIMLGVFGNIPAYDRFFKNGMKVHGLTKKSLEKIGDFYEANKKVIDELQDETTTLDFSTEKHTKMRYTKAKIIDMYGFMKGGGWRDD